MSAAIERLNVVSARERLRRALKLLERASGQGSNDVNGPQPLYWPVSVGTALTTIEFALLDLGDDSVRPFGESTTTPTRRNTDVSKI
jgi:hypothetical protein